MATTKPNEKVETRDVNFKEEMKEFCRRKKDILSRFRTELEQYTIEEIKKALKRNVR